MTYCPSATVPFYKMQGSGNDFVVIDNRTLKLPREAMSEWASKICPRAFGVGADGLIFLENAPEGSELDFVWHFYNADGSRAEMCGNGSRCAARLGHELGFGSRTLVFGTDAGPIHAEVSESLDIVKVELTPPLDLALNAELDVDGQKISVHFVNTGVPHAVTIWDDVASLDVVKLGRALRNHPHFAPAGTNVNFIEIKDKNHILIRTYERGVEGETYACGTGNAASALIAHELGLVDAEVELTTSGNEILNISIEKDTVFLQGKAIKTYKGEMYLEALGITPREEMRQCAHEL
ncbi:diaminopimelate epimerase [Desulfobaculum bizertense]|uniref:diaminopimelate epimerase n=1 Tax=Desulfobaculum bizertense TaxID=376490 RepID=UPI001F188963|nr:diaminopimelate epimerase [Desulfobaculum bizertense]UIJ38766.1 diaminopimelate epimerase [Desulfobaculum bizertense]